MPIEKLNKVGTRPLRIIDLRGESETSTFRDDVHDGLTNQPKSLPCQYFYDEDGSLLFEQICELPEYYLTRAEDEILASFSDEMVSGWNQPPAIVELGSGSSTKTRHLIEAAIRRYGSLHYIPIDISLGILEASSRSLMRRFPGLQITAYAADYRTALSRLAPHHHRPQLFVFLGSSLGNYDCDESIDLLRRVSFCMGEQDRFLLGTDLVKDPKVLEAAYDDSQGITARFNLNLLDRINRELEANFDLNSFAHEARYVAEKQCIEMHLVSLIDQLVSIPSLPPIGFQKDESIHTENSHKYTREYLRELADASGFFWDSTWTDSRRYFSVQRWQRDC